MKVFIVINIHILTAIDITVVLYFFLLLFRFLYAKVPPVLNTLLITLGTFNFLDFILIFSAFLKSSIGLTLLALLAEKNADRYIVINPSTKAKNTDHIFTPNKIPIYSFK